MLPRKLQCIYHRENLPLILYRILVASCLNMGSQCRVWLSGTLNQSTLGETDGGAGGGWLKNWEEKRIL